MSDSAVVCPVCSAPTTPVGTVQGRTTPETFRLRHCAACGYTFVENPIANYQLVYDEKYYRGQGADPMLDYVNELEKPERSVRNYEWRGILTAVNALVPLTADTQWLDFGCGNGGQVRYVRSHSVCRPVGFEEGWIAERARAQGIPILKRDDLAAYKGAFDVISAIEVLEHIPDPLSCLREIRTLLRPGGLLFLTTGNAAPHQSSIAKWPYVIPDIHVSFFEPRTLEKALVATGFRPEYRGAVAGYTDVLRFKILKNLGFRRTSFFEKLLPWSILARLADSRYKISAHPIGWAV